MADGATAKVAAVTGKRQAGCACLRWKGMYIEAERDPLVPNTSDGLFWCSHTMNCLGPDDRVADRDACTPDRGCFETR